MKFINLQYVFLLLSLQGHYRVTDENLLFETAQYGPSTFFRVCSLLLKELIFVILFTIVYKTHFDETYETYLEQNPGMEIAEAEGKTFDELKSNYRQALISNYHDLVQLGSILKKTQSTNK